MTSSGPEAAHKQASQVATHAGAKAANRDTVKIPAAAHAQAGGPAQTLLDGTVVGNLGGFVIGTDFKASLNGESTNNSEIDFDKTFGNGSDQTRIRGDVLWRISPNHHLRFLYFNDTTKRKRVIDSDPPLAKTELRYLRELLRRELGDVRAFISQLRPPLLDDLGLNGAIVDNAQHMQGLIGVPSATDLTAPTDQISDAQQTVVLRVAQEALQNMRKHAAASHVVVATRLEGSDWVLEVRDDGRGFDMQTVAARGRRNFGLQFMRERAELVGARFDVRSRLEGGTVVRLAIPTGPATGGEESS